MTRPIAILLALLGVIVVLLGAHHARAAQTAVVVTACGIPPVTYAAGQQQPILQNVGGSLCTLGGGGGGGGGPVTAGVGAFVDGWSVTDGVTTDAVCSTDTGTCTEVALFKRNNARLTSVITALGGLFPAGGSIGNTAFGISGTLPAFAAIPTFKIDQTTPGTTNGVSASNFPATVDTNAGAAGVATLRTVIATGGATVPISAAALPLPTGAMAATGGTVGLVAGSAIVGKISQVDSSGNDSTDTTNHAVRVNVVAGGVGGGPVTIADGADVTQGSKADPKSAATDATAITVMQVLKEISAMEQAPPTRAVTNGGTFATQVTAALPAGAAIIGQFGIDQTVPGTTNGVQVNAGAAIMGKVSQVDSTGVDATDTVNHAVNVSCISGCPAAITNYEQETGGNADLQTSYLLALKNAIGLPIPAQATDGVNIGGIEGLAARGTTATGNPVLTGCRGATTSPVAVTNGQAVEVQCSETGKVVTLPYSISANFVSGVISTAMTATTSTQLLAAPAAGLRNYVTHLTCGNAAATQGTFIIVQDGATGTTIYEFPAAPAYGGASLTLPTPLRQPTTATGLFVQNVTSGASVTCSATGYVAP